MHKNNIDLNLCSLLGTRPDAWASINGSNDYPEIYGEARFYQTKYGTLVSVQINGLPYIENVCENRFFGFHIHEGSSCTGNESDPFADALSHYNPNNCPHPHHSGDLPPLFNMNGYALSVFISDRFTVDEIIGKTIIIHSEPDDFTTQPSGNSGTKIACGMIVSTIK